MIKLFALLVLATSLAQADEWEFFPASTIVKYGCISNGPIIVQLVGESAPEREVYMSEAWANTTQRTDGQHDWSFKVGEWPYNAKGESQAIEACKKWQLKATKLVKKAKGIK